MNRAMKAVVQCVLIIGLIISPAMGTAAADTSESHAETLQLLINDIEKAIADADNRMVAHPSFLDELRALVQTYKAKIREVFFSDDFSDGNYTQVPKWTVESGRFKVTSNQRLYCQVKEKPARASQNKQGTGDQGRDVFGLILKGVLDATTEDSTSQESTPTQNKKEYEKRAFIKTNCTIAPAFEVDVSIRAEPSQGAMELVLLGGKPAQPRYRLVYNASPSQDRPIQIIRERGGRSYVIETATKYPMLEDSNTHRIQWIRNTQGDMSVLVDGQPVLSTVELFYRDQFSGFGLANQGGTFQWNSVRILQPAPEYGL